MKKYRTVNEIRQALDCCLQIRGNSHDGAHYLRPDGSRGPIVEYLPSPYELIVAVDHADGGGWMISKAWFMDNKLSNLFWLEYGEVEE